MKKYVSLADALKSGKNFAYRIPGGIWMEHRNNVSKNFSPMEIVHAECELEYAPREIWIWQFNNREFDSSFYGIKDDCAERNKGWAGKPIKFREVLEETNGNP